MVYSADFFRLPFSNYYAIQSLSLKWSFAKAPLTLSFSLALFHSPLNVSLSLASKMFTHQSFISFPFVLFLLKSANYPCLLDYFSANHSTTKKTHSNESYEMIEWKVKLVCSLVCASRMSIGIASNQIFFLLFSLNISWWYCCCSFSMVLRDDLMI